MEIPGKCQMTTLTLSDVIFPGENAAVNELWKLTKGRLHNSWNRKIESVLRLHETWTVHCRLNGRSFNWNISLLCLPRNKVLRHNTATTWNGRMSVAFSPRCYWERPLVRFCSLGHSGSRTSGNQVKVTQPTHVAHTGLLNQQKSAEYFKSALWRKHPAVAGRADSLCSNSSIRLTLELRFLLSRLHRRVPHFRTNEHLLYNINSS